MHSVGILNKTFCVFTWVVSEKKPEIMLYNFDVFWEGVLLSNEQRKAARITRTQVAYIHMCFVVTCPYPIVGSRRSYDGN